MLRKLIAKLNSSMAERVVPVRHKRQVPIRLRFEPNGDSERLNAPPKIVFITGETADLSCSGIAFIVSSIRIKEEYLVGEGRVLLAELDLPNGKVSMKIVGQRYERVGEQVSTARYLVGASIREISDENRKIYNDFLRLSDKKGNTGSLRLGVNRS